ncbi:LysR family transcriptional regulator [Muribaculaceae bacterium Isolate-002 (NCI)]|nr:LysR family transcriptional regulator [Muribaculaceae bacterium Isolate-002 (NCI)]
MELRQLRYFVAAARALNFSEASAKVNITQSTLSQQIRQLEDELGTQLFYRNSHSVKLTEEGERLLPLAIDTLNSAESCADAVKNIHGLVTGTLNIGVTYSFSPILTETMLEFMQRYPGIKLNVYYKTMAELLVMLSNYEVDFVLAFMPDNLRQEIESHILFDSHLAAIVNKDHPLAGQPKAGIDDLRQYAIALPSPGLQARNAFDRLLGAYAGTQRIKVELNEVNILMQLVRHSQMVTVLAETSVYGNDDMRAIPIDIPGNKMAGSVLTLRGTYRKHATRTFIAMLTQSRAVLSRRNNWL